VRLTIVAASLLGLGCGDVCKTLSPSFQLDVRSSSGVASMQVLLRLGSDEFVRTFNLDGALDDGEASLAIELDPEMKADFELDVMVTAYSGTDGRGGVVASGGERFSGTPDGCNHFAVELEPPPPELPEPQPRSDPENPENPQVLAGEPCDLDCVDSTCNLACDLSCSLCASKCAGSSSCNVACENAGSCDVDCNGTRACTASCGGTASCRLDCRNASTCGFTVCESGAISCTDGSIVCGRACP
jgi:hypothetical protein